MAGEPYGGVGVRLAAAPVRYSCIMDYRAAIIGVATVGLLASCGGDDDDLRSCADVVADGAPTPDLAGGVECLTSGSEVDVVSATHSAVCEDGRRVFANEFGYGIEGSPWIADASGEGGPDMSANSAAADFFRRCGA